MRKEIHREWVCENISSKIMTKLLNGLYRSIAELIHTLKNDISKQKLCLCHFKDR
jgi:hypothetical protein